MRSIVFAVLCMLSLTSCDNGDKQVFEATVSLKNHRFIPNKVMVPAGQKIRLIVHNKDNIVEEFESFDLKREKIVPPNGTIRVMLAPLKPGKYHFFGEFHEETAQGDLIAE